MQTVWKCLCVTFSPIGYCMKKKAWFYLLSIYSYQDICIVWFNNYLYVVLKWIIFIKKSENCLMWFLSLWFLSVCLSMSVWLLGWERKMCVYAITEYVYATEPCALPYTHLHIQHTCVYSLRFQHCALITAFLITLCIAQFCFCWKASNPPPV